MEKVLTHGSLFSGIGGIDLGFERAGIKTIWQCEFDDKASEVLARRFPGVPNYHDVRKVTNDGTIAIPDIISGGFPCQDVSVAGKRKGLDGERSGLWFEFARIIDEFEPRWVVAENVPGLLSSNRGGDFATVIRWLADRGYCVGWRVLDAQYFGVAQRRRRVFIVGSFGNGSAAEVLFEREGVRWDTPPRRKAGERIAGTLDGKSCSSNRGSQANETDFIVQQAVTHSGGVTLKLGDRANTINTQTGSETTAMFNGVIAYENHPNDSRITETGDISQQLTSRMGTGGGNVPLVQVLNDQGGNVMSVTEDITATLRTQEHGHQPIVMAHGQGGAEISSERSPALTCNHEAPILNGVRRLTPTEYERLQGFPDGWTDEQADSHRYKQLGNAVCVNVAEWIGRRIEKNS